MTDVPFGFNLRTEFLLNVASSVLEEYRSDAESTSSLFLNVQRHVFDKDIITFSVCVHISIVDVSEGV